MPPTDSKAERSKRASNLLGSARAQPEISRPPDTQRNKVSPPSPPHRDNVLPEQSMGKIPTSPETDPTRMPPRAPMAISEPHTQQIPRTRWSSLFRTRTTPPLLQDENTCEPTHPVLEVDPENEEESTSPKLDATALLTCAKILSVRPSVCIPAQYQYLLLCGLQATLHFEHSLVFSEEAQALVPPNQSAESARPHASQFDRQRSKFDFHEFIHAPTQSSKNDLCGSFMHTMMQHRATFSDWDTQIKSSATHSGHTAPAVCTRLFAEAAAVVACLKANRQVGPTWSILLWSSNATTLITQPPPVSRLPLSRTRAQDRDWESGLYHTAKSKHGVSQYTEHRTDASGPEDSPNSDFCFDWPYKTASVLTCATQRVQRLFLRDPASRRFAVAMVSHITSKVQSWQQSHVTETGHEQKSNDRRTLRKPTHLHNGENTTRRLRTNALLRVSAPLAAPSQPRSTGTPVSLETPRWDVSDDMSAYAHIHWVLFHHDVALAHAFSESEERRLMSQVAAVLARSQAHLATAITLWVTALSTIEKKAESTRDALVEYAPDILRAAYHDMTQSDPENKTAFSETVTFDETHTSPYMAEVIAEQLWKVRATSILKCIATVLVQTHQPCLQINDFLKVNGEINAICFELEDIVLEWPYQ